MSQYLLPVFYPPVCAVTPSTTRGQTLCYATIGWWKVTPM